jgi:hypothetical protein
LNTLAINFYVDNFSIQQFPRHRGYLKIHFNTMKVAKQND